MTSIPIVVHPAASGSGPRHGEPATLGLPLPPGLVVDHETVHLTDGSGHDVPMQVRPLARWTDGSVRWLRLDFEASTNEQGEARYTVRLDGASRSVTASPLRIEQHAAGVSVDTGGVRFQIVRGQHGLLERVNRAGAEVIAAPIELRLRHDRRVWRSTVTAIVVEGEGPLTATVRVDGRLGGGPGRPLIFSARLKVAAGSATVRCAVTIRNPNRARHPGGFWDLGDSGSVCLDALDVTVPLLPGPRVARCSPERGLPLADVGLPFAIYQDSSGGDAWQSSVHLNRHGRVPHQLRGYRFCSADEETRGLRATPVVQAQTGEQVVSIALPYFWQNFPMAIEVRDDAMTIGLFPSHAADGHEFQGGEQKTHEFAIAFGPDLVTSVPLDWCRSPTVAHAEPSWYAHALATMFLTPATEETSHAYLELIASGVEGPTSFFAKREVIDEYGWRHFGDLYADHEAVGHRGGRPLVSHYNNQYDAVAGFAQWFMRTGDLRWWTLMRDLAAHVIDIDIYHTDDDRAAYNGGMFWHTVHYRDAGAATHRAYPRGAAGVHGGGPSPEHCYTAGLRVYAWLTGDRAPIDAVLELGDWILAADDGALSRFRWFAGGATGLATASGTPLYHGPGRGGANSIATLLDCDLLSSDPKYLRKAEEIIRRAVHPAQDIEALDLGDVERRWFYTMFLQSLGRYLEHKRERGERDAMTAYARASLLHFARWMAAHESPYLDRPEILEYPNETWAAQDMRKSEVFYLAALHARTDERERFLERGDFFFRYSVDTLSQSPARGLTRPLVLLLGNGSMRAWTGRQAANLALAEADKWPVSWRAGHFEPQKVRALRRVRRTVAALAALGAVIVAWFALQGLAR